MQLGTQQTMLGFPRPATWYKVSAPENPSSCHPHTQAGRLTVSSPQSVCECTVHRRHTCRGWMPPAMRSEIMRTLALFFGSRGRSRGVGRVSSRYSMMASCPEEQLGTHSEESTDRAWGHWIRGDRTSELPLLLLTCLSLGPMKLRRVSAGGLALFGSSSCRTGSPYAQISLHFPKQATIFLPPPNINHAGKSSHSGHRSHEGPPKPCTH